MMTSSTSEKPLVELTKGVNGLEKVILREVRGSSAEVYLYGGQVTSWKNDLREELLFVSSKAIFKPPKAIRGGIPICFPQFANRGPLESHGFARNRFWSIDKDPPPFPASTSSRAFVDLILKPSEEDLKIWPHSFEFRLRVALSPAGDLMLTSRIRNTSTDGKPFAFTFAYHTYFSVSDIRYGYPVVLSFSSCFLRILGSSQTIFHTPLVSFAPNSPPYTRGYHVPPFLLALTPPSSHPATKKVDKIYLSTPTKIAILDHEKKRTFVIRKDGLPDAVVWNPWDKRAKAIADFGDEEYKHMLCVEAAAVEKPITLKPGEEWRGRQELSAVPSSYCSGQLDPKRVLLGS
ncbi:putative glucose-6-phosphate 1-epimerase [Solanum stenotomum]|uniref:putative glucose-6-phosphate 1-epimerase n=1 Tax=Solanum stenotomum TaxID=172797 RepID=UPI0020D0DCBC|nr:putative glucose-6-phosphate 1-epimerase [Solanum stenotomum]